MNYKKKKKNFNVHKSTLKAIEMSIFDFCINFGWS